MDEQNVVELSLRLPAGQLGQLARLMEQVRGILALEGGGAASPASAGPSEHTMEAGVNTGFDAVRFRQLDRAAPSAAPEPEAPDTLPAKMEAGVRDTAPEIPTAAAGTGDGPDEADSAGASMQTAPEAAEVEASVLAELEIPAVETELSPGPETPAGSVKAAERAGLEAAAVMPSEQAQLSVPVPAVSNIRRDFEGARSVGATVEAEPAEVHGGALAAVEELVSAGPAPLTAESVALAFQRDDRRYDNGFPLY